LIDNIPTHSELFLSKTKQEEIYGTAANTKSTVKTDLKLSKAAVPNYFCSAPPFGNRWSKEYFKRNTYYSNDWFEFFGTDKSNIF
jgi:hypothetical protein